MGSFSERLGLKPVREAIQGRFLDAATRAQLWSAIALSVPEYRNDLRYPFEHTWMYSLYQEIWADLLKKPVDEMPRTQDYIRSALKRIVIDGEWYEAYDVIEFMINSERHSSKADFSKRVAGVLEQEMAGFRLLEGQLVEVTDESEISAIEEAFAASRTEKFSPARQHLTSALELLSDRRSPDYRNSIKESISSVEAVIQILTGDPRAELGAGLSVLESRTPLHGALRSALRSLYGYTSDADGIRHGRYFRKLWMA